MSQGPIAGAPQRILSSANTPFVVVGVLFTVLAGKLVYVQAVKSSEIARDVDSIVEKHLKLVAPRGRIFDAQGTLLAGTRGIVHLVADGRELRKIEERNAAKRVPYKGQEPPREIVEKRRDEIVKMRGALVLDLAAALDRTLGATAGGVDARARDVAARLGRLVTNRDGVTAPATYVPIAREITTDAEARVREILKKHRVSAAFALEEDFDRTYPAGVAAAPVVGFFGARVQSRAASPTKTTKSPETSAPADDRKADLPERTGQGGIEQYYEEKLRGVGGSTVVQRAPNVDGGFLDLDRDVAPVPGADIYLTMDAKLGAILHEEAVAAHGMFPCDGITAVALEAQTGRVLAMASTPGFDPNPAPGAKNHALNNFAIGYSYEPGSSIKPFTVAAALDAGVLQPDDQFDVNFPSGWAVPKRAKAIRDSHVFHGILDVTGILARSSNIGAVKIGHKAGPDAIYEAFRNYGFGSRTGIEFPFEGKIQLPRRGSVPWDVPNTLTSVSFGYQFYATPLRLAAAYCSIANGGMRVEPRLVESIVYPDGHVENPVAPPPVRVMSEQTARTVREMLQSVVRDPHGTAHTAATALAKAGFVEVEQFAGKTGTAVIHKNPSNMNGTFAVFGPMPEPRVVVVFVVFNSRARFGGTQVAEPAMRALARALRATGVTAPGARSVNLDAAGAPPVQKVEDPSISQAPASAEAKQTSIRSTNLKTNQTKEIKGRTQRNP